MTGSQPVGDGILAPSQLCAIGDSCQNWIQFDAFRSHPIIRGGHLQTIWGSLARASTIPYRAAPHHVALADGDRLILHEECPTAERDCPPVTVLLHGMAGSHASPYMVRLSSRLASLGHRVFRMDARGCGAGRPFATQVTHAARSDDPRAVLDYLSQRYPGSVLNFVGVSLGGNQLLKMLGELSDCPLGGRLQAALGRCVAVSPPMEPAVCSRHMQRLLLRPYCRYFIKLLMRRVPPAVAQSDLWRRLTAGRPPRTMWEFDQRITAPLAGYPNAESYYEAGSSARLLERICTKTLILAAGDDPLIPASIFRRSYPEPVQLMLSPRGGHVGFIGRGRQRHWMDDVIVRFLEPTQATAQ